VELGTEELPPQSLKKLAHAFADNFFQGLVSLRVVESSADYRVFATPRRLAVWVSKVRDQQADRTEERRGPALKAAFDDHNHPTKAALGFARSCGVNVSQLKFKETDKGSWVIFLQQVRGEKLRYVVNRCLNNTVRALPIPKKMRWGSGNKEFVRPVKWLLALYGCDVLHVEVLGLKADGITKGHRFHCQGDIRVPSADCYANMLKSFGYVIADFGLRRSMIEKQISRLALKAKAKVIVNKELLDLVTGLVEWPQELIGEFDKRFLDIPHEVLIFSMRDHQKYFHLVDEKGKLLPLFITVSNLKSKFPQRVRLGNEKVLRARLSDAEFFWHADQTIALVDRFDSLQQVLFHHKLGSIYEKALRIESLALFIAKQLNIKSDFVSRAARLCKTDLVTDMVREFPALQGTIGSYYAIIQGENKKVAQAIDAHYLPRFSGDLLPKDKISQSVALADRLDTLVGILAFGQEVPRGDKDPFALRRTALSVLRILIEKKINLDVYELISKSHGEYAKTLNSNNEENTESCDQVFAFLLDRLKAYYQSKGFRYDEISAVLAIRPHSPLDFDRRLKALSKFFRKRKKSAQSLAAANKRISNILIKSVLDTSKNFNSNLVQKEEEMVLADDLLAVKLQVSDYFTHGLYDQIFEVLATLRSSVDNFFDKVVVMDPNLEIRNNRLALLIELRNLFLQAADISVVKNE